TGTHRLVGDDLKTHLRFPEFQSSILISNGDANERDAFQHGCLSSVESSHDMLPRTAPEDVPRFDVTATIASMAIVMVSRDIGFDALVIDFLLPDLVGHDKRPTAFVLYVSLWAMTRG